MKDNMKSIDRNNRILYNFIENKQSNVECLFIKDYDIILIQWLDGSINSFQKHASFEKFLDSELREAYQFIDLNDTTIINETDSDKLFQRVRGKVKIILFDPTKPFHNDIFKYCTWLRIYTWSKK